MINQDKELEYLKILIIGDSGVGKSSILSRYTDETFDENISGTVGIDYKSKDLQIDDKKIKLRIWDSAGQERYRAITHNFLKGAVGILIVFDMTNKQSFQNLDTWFSQIKLYTNEDTQIILVGNKIDYVDKIEVDLAQVKQYCEFNDVDFFNVSAKTGKNVPDVFYLLTKKILKNFDKKNNNQNEHNINKRISTASQGIKLTKSKIKPKKLDTDNSCAC